VKILPFAAITLTALIPVPAMAHEPLWGETPTIFGPGVFHPEIRFMYMPMGAPDRPGDSATRSLEQEYGLQYGVNRWINTRLVIPFALMKVEENVGGSVDETSVSGWGDIRLEAKYRFHLVQDTGRQQSQTLTFGWKLPTGEDAAEGPDGNRLPPGDQPGTGHHGVSLGYAFDRETLRDTLWASALYRHEIGDALVPGDHVEWDVAYGWWIVRTNSTDHAGFMLASGLHGEADQDDRLENGASADNAHRFAGIQLSPILTKGRYQLRLGVFVPLLKRGDEGENDFGYEVRAGWEAFF
jgi:hypothetical protein